MKVDEKVKLRLQDVVQLGEAALRNQNSNNDGDTWLNQTTATQWVASARSLLANVFGESSQYFLRLLEVTKVAYVSETALQQGHGVVLAAQADYLAGGIINVRRLVEAEVFDDFLEQAEHLLDHGYFRASAVIAGCVLEDALRRMCARSNVPLLDRPKLDSMNAELAKKGVYDKLVQKRITAESALRNRAAHGEWDAFSEADVQAMLKWVRRFLEDHSL